MKKYLKKIIAIALAFVMVMTGFSVETWGISEAWADSVIEISSADDLMALGGRSISGDYRLTQDIDMTDKSMTPISSFRNGTFDGCGFTIKNLSATGSGNTGLFAELGSSATITGLTLSECQISNASGSYCGVGGLVGKVTASGSVIENCGIVGGTISSTSPSDVYLGGLVGYGSSAVKISGCFSTAAIHSGTSTSSRAGGLIGSATSGTTIENCYTRGTVYAKNGYGGGISGYLYGSSSSKIKVSNTYTAAIVSGTKSKCYPVAYCYGSYNQFDHCFYNSETEQSVTANTQEGISAKSAADIQTSASFLGGAFQDDLVQQINAGYPILKWQNPDAEYSVTIQVSPTDAAVTINGERQQQSETGSYTLTGLKSGAQRTYTVSQNEGADTDLAPQSGTITVGKSDIVKSITLIPNEYEVKFNVLPEEAAFSLTDGESKTVSPKSGRTYSLTNGTYTYSTELFGYKLKTGSITVDKAGQDVDVTLEAQPTQTVSFAYRALIENEAVQNGSITVTTGGRTMEPESDGMTYKLPAGYAYTYTFKSSNYSKVSGTLDFTGLTEGQAHSVTIPLSAKIAWEGNDDIIEPAQKDGIYQISCGAELAWIAQQVNSGKNTTCKAVLTKDIDLGNEPWTPIGKSGYSYQFAGTFDGQGHEVRNLKIDTSGTDQGLFGYISGAVIENVSVRGNITSSSISSSGGTAGIAGTMSGSSAAETRISNCISYVNVTGGNNVGGIVGYFSTSNKKTIENCVNYGSITGNNNVGGLAGYLYYKGSILNSYNRGSVEAKFSKAGGLAGYMNDAGAVLENCYSTGTVAGNSDANPLIGKKSSGTVTNCYYQGEEGADANETEKTAEEMKSADFIVSLGSAFIGDMPEKINDGYPILAFQDTTPKYDVKITVTPTNTTLKVFNDENIEAAPASIEDGVYSYSLPAGTYRYTAEAFGYITEQNSFDITAEQGSHRKEISLHEAEKYTLSFQIMPDTVPNLTIQVLYNEEAVTPSAAGVYLLPEGEYTWIVKARGYGRQTGTVTLKNNETIHITLTESKAWDGETKEPVVPEADGTYEISSGEELAWFAEQVNSGTGKNYHAVLTDNIDLGDYPFTPIGAAVNASSKEYAGVFDGNGYTISGINISGESNYVGLFGTVKGTSTQYAEIKNLTVRGKIESTSGFLGGIAGTAEYANITNCHNYADITMTGASTKSYIGGIVGTIGNSSMKGSICNCANYGTVSGANVEKAGGIAGYNYYATVDACYNAGSVSGKQNIGGVIGQAGGTVSDVYNIGTVTGQSGNVGGVIAYVTTTVSNVYAAGTVENGKAVFGLVSNYSGETENSYYLDTLPEDGNAAAKTAAQLRDLTDTLNGERTGENAVWKSAPAENNGYPILFWQKTEQPIEDQPLAEAQNVHWKYHKEDYIDPDTQELLPADENSWNCFFCMEPVAMWDEVPHAASYTVALWKEGFVWQELDESRRQYVMNSNNPAASRLRYIDESKIIEAMTESEKESYKQLEEAVAEANANLNGSKASKDALKAAISAQENYLVGMIDDGNHEVSLGVYSLGIEKIKQVENVTAATYDFTKEITDGGEYAYYFTVTPVAAEGSGYISGTVPESMTSSDFADLYDDDWTCCYNHLTKPYNLQWDGTVAKWNGSENAEFYSFILYAVGGTEEEPVYTQLHYEIIDPAYTQIDCGRYFTADGKYAFTVRSEAGEEGRINGHSSSGISAYSPVYTVGNAQIPDENRDGWTAISTAEEWIALANIEDVPVSAEDNTSKQAAAWNKKYYLTDDIDFSELSAANQAKTKSIGNVTNRFMGTLDGNGHKITGLTLSNNDAGLFAYIGATGLVYDLTIENANVLFSDNAAVLAHYNYGTILNCAVRNCNITADTGAVLGGMVSRNYGIIKKSYVEGGTLTSNSKTATGHAGFVGSNEETGFIEQCWTSMNVQTQSEYAGGFLGLGYGGTIKDCFALGDVSARGYSGGFVGRSVFNGNIYENCYAAGKVTVTDAEGHGFIGGNKPDSNFQYDQSKGIINCYYNADSPADTNGAAAKTISEMQSSDFLRALNGSGNAWIQNTEKNNGMPYLGDVKAPERAATDRITVEIAIATYDKNTYSFEKMGDTISVSMDSNGNTRVVDLMDAAAEQNLLTYSYDTTSTYGRYIHTINGRAVESPDGWMFTINDKLSNVSASLATVKDGDKLLWYEGTTENLYQGPTWTELVLGKEENWIDIRSTEDFMELANASDEMTLGKMYRLQTDLDLTGVSFAGIGSKEKPFTGVFDGQNHTISNAVVSRNEDGTGFFNAIKGASIQNLNLKAVDIAGTSRVGGLVGFAMAELDKENMAASKANLIGNCSVSGKVTGTDTQVGCTGGLVGENGGAYDKDTLFSIYSAIDKCTADVEVIGKYKTGGLAGDNRGNITKSSAAGTVAGIITTGGFAGDNTGDIYDCHGDGAVTGSNYTGGFAGYSDGIVKNCYSLGNVTGTDYTGGFAGAISHADYVISAGKVAVEGTPSHGYNGGFAGQLGGVLTGLENQITIKDAYGNCTEIASVIGNTSQYNSDSQKEKLEQMTLGSMQETGRKLYEMFGINMPSSLAEEADKYLDAAAAAQDATADSRISVIKKNETADEEVTVNYVVDSEGSEYLSGGRELILKKANDTSSTIQIPVTLQLENSQGTFTKEIKVILPVSVEKRSELMDTIASGYTDSSDFWTAMDMSVYASLEGKTYLTSDSALQNMLNVGITEAAGSQATASDRARLEITLRSVGIDTSRLYKANEVKAINNGSKLAEMNLTAGGYYGAPWILLADMQGNTGLSESQKKSLIQLIKENIGEGLFGYDWNGTHFDDPDTAGAVLAALARFYDTDKEAKEIIDTILAALPKAMDETGSFGNANSDAMIIIGLIAVGVDPSEIKTEGGVSIVDGLLTHVNTESNQFTYGGKDNALATEQGFRALIAMTKFAGTSYNIYDFGQKTVSAGHATGEGEIVIPPAPDEGNDDITVTVSIQADTEMWMNNKSVTVKEGSTVYHAFVKALEGSGITQIGAENGYVRSLTKDGKTLGEFTKGENSGWLYKVNGILPNVGLTSYEIGDGDTILWYYTTDYTKDPDAGGILVPEQSEVKTSKDPVSGITTTTTPTEVTVSGDTAKVTVKTENMTEAIKQAKENKSAEIVLQVSASDTKGAETVQLQLDVSFVKNVIEKTDAALTVSTENGRVSLDKEALNTIVSEAKGSTVTLEVVKVANPTDIQKKAAGTNGYIIRLVVKSGDKIISDFNKGTATVTVEIPSQLLDKKVAAIYIADDGTIEQLNGRTLEISGKKYYEFTTPHFSTFALVDADELGLEVTEMTAAQVKELTAKLTPVARSAKTEKKTVKVTLNLDKQDKEIISQLEEAGYTVKYKFYRSTKKASKYASKLTSKKASYTNTAGKKGTKYYYKARVQVYDKDGQLVAQTLLKQCKYACRTWSK